MVVLVASYNMTQNSATVCYLAIFINLPIVDNMTFDTSIHVLHAYLYFKLYLINRNFQITFVAYHKITLQGCAGSYNNFQT